MLRGLSECMMRVKTKGASQPSRARRGIWLGKQILTGNNVSFSEKKFVFFVFLFLFLFLFVSCSSFSFLSPSSFLVFLILFLLGNCWVDCWLLGCWLFLLL